MQCFYSPGYYVPLPEGHPFPISKYPRSLEFLKSWDRAKDISYQKVNPARMEDVLRVHSESYLDQIRHGTLSKYASNRLGLPVHERFLERSLLDVGATIAAAHHAMEHGVAWNLGGGTHHAMAEEGLGFCITNDVSIAVLRLKHLYKDLNILVLDTDAHQGNGNHLILRGQDRVFTYSIHVGANYPALKEAGDMDVPLERYVSGDGYLVQFADSLRALKARFSPDIVFWISGVDPHENDRFGQMKLSDVHLAERNRMVFEYILGEEAAMVGTYGGGYHYNEDATARLHAESVLQSFELL